MATRPSEEANRAPGLKRLTPTQVAVELGIRYLRARDLMTQGKLGVVTTDDKGRMTVPLMGVVRYKQERDAPKP